MRLLMFDGLVGFGSTPAVNRSSDQDMPAISLNVFSEPARLSI